MLQRVHGIHGRGGTIPRRRRPYAQRSYAPIRCKPGARPCQRSAIFPRECSGCPRAARTNTNGCGRLGPTSPALIEYLKRQHRSYDALVFFSLYHPTTVFGLAIAPERSVLFPCLRLDPALRFGIWSDLLGSVKAIGYLSAAERHQTQRFFRLPTPDEVVGLGIEAPAQQTYPVTSRIPPTTWRKATLTSTSHRKSNRPKSCRSRRAVSTPSPPLRSVRALRGTHAAEQRLRGTAGIFRRVCASGTGPLRWC